MVEREQIAVGVDGDCAGTSMLAGGEFTDDAFHGGKLQLLQPSKGYRAGMDAVLLAAATRLRDNNPAGMNVLDLGAGVGTVGLCLARRVASCRVVLLEKQTEMVRLALENVARNDLRDRVRVVEGDVYWPAVELEAVGVKANAFDHVVANPPYFVAGRGTRSPVEQKARSHELGEERSARGVGPRGAVSRSEGAASPGRDDHGFEGWARVMARAVKPGGGVSVIHLAEALPEILSAFRGRFGGLIVQPVHPRAGACANRVIVSGTKGSRAGLVIADRFVLHGEDGRFTTQANAIFRDGAALAPEASI